MIAILPLREMSVLTELNEKEHTNAHHAFCFYDGNEMKGYVLYSISDKQGQLLATNAVDNVMLDGLVRATLASLLDADINSAEFSHRFNISALRELNIIGESQEKVTSIHKLFYNCKSCQNCDVK